MLCITTAIVYWWTWVSMTHFWCMPWRFIRGNMGHVKRWALFGSNGTTLKSIGLSFLGSDLLGASLTLVASCLSVGFYIVFIIGCLWLPCGCWNRYIIAARASKRQRRSISEWFNVARASGDKKLVLMLLEFHAVSTIINAWTFFRRQVAHRRTVIYWSRAEFAT